MDDAVIYLTTAQNLATGRGLTWVWGDGTLQPLTWFPPLFSILLAGAVRLGISAVTTARWLNAALFGLSAVLTAGLARRGTGSWVWGGLAGLLFLSSAVLIEVYSWAMSEALYITLALAGMLVFDTIWQPRAASQPDVRVHKPGRTLWLAVAALLFGLAFVTRYIGFSLLLAGLSALVLRILVAARQERDGASLRDMIRRYLPDVLLFGTLSALPMAFWMVRTLLLIGSPIDRSAGMHLVTLNQLQKAANTVLSWFIPGRLVNGREWLVLLGAVLVLALVMILLRRSPSQRRSGWLELLLGLQVLLHGFVLWLSKSFFEPSTPLNDRILSPVLPSLLVLLVLLLARLWDSAVAKPGESSWPRTWPPAWQPAIAAGLALLVLGLSLYRSMELVPRLHTSGLGIARRAWHGSETLEAVRQLPPGPIFSNSPAAIYYWTGRPAYPVFSLDQVRQGLQDPSARLVVFNSISLDLYDTSLDVLTAGLVQDQQFRDGSIYLGQ